MKYYLIVLFSHVIFEQTFCLTIISDKRFTTDADTSVQLDCLGVPTNYHQEIIFNVNDFNVYSSKTHRHAPHVRVQNVTSIILDSGAVYPQSTGIKAFCSLPETYTDSAPIRIPHIVGPVSFWSSNIKPNVPSSHRKCGFSVTCSVNVQPRQTMWDVYNVTFFREGKPFAAYTASKKSFKYIQKI